MYSSFLNISERGKDVLPNEKKTSSRNTFKSVKIVGKNVDVDFNCNC